MVGELKETFCDEMMAFIVDCAQVRCEHDFQCLVDGHLQVILPHGSMLCGVGSVTAQGSTVQKMCSYHLQESAVSYYAALLGGEGKLDSPLMKRWRSTQEPVYFQSQRDEGNFSDEWVAAFQHSGMRNTIGHGILDLGYSLSSFFIFNDLPTQVGERHAFLLRILTPHLHGALTRILANLPLAPWQIVTPTKPLSERQRQILFWVQEGKTNWEIATILGLKEVNVKYHIDQIFLKLQVRKRVHAVSKARGLGLFSSSMPH